MKIEKVYVDMDGVLCNFEKRYTSLFGHLSDKDRRGKFYENFIHFVDDGNFETLEPLDDFLILKNYLDSKQVTKQICSSTASQELYAKIKPQKEAWLRTHGVNWSEPIFVPGKQYKYRYATPESIIIDDTLSVIEDWRKAGGIAIWHKDALTTISQLEMYLKNG
jgi:hypothetical protein